MKQAYLGDERLSVIGLGAMPLAIAGRPSEADARNVISAALDAQMTWIDVADSYCLDQDDTGYGEQLVARALRDYGTSKRVLIATKAGYVRPGGNWELCGRPEHLRAACERSLRTLGLEALPLFQLHGVDPKVYYPDSVGALADLQREGKVIHIGLCNVDVGHLEDARKIIRVATVQNRCNIHERWCFENGVVPWCEQHGALFIAHSTMGGHQGHKRTASSVTLANVAARHEVSPYQIALAWLLRQSPALLAIPGASRPESAISSAAAAELKLTTADLEELASEFPPPRRLVKELKRVKQIAKATLRRLKDARRRL